MKDIWYCFMAANIKIVSLYLYMRSCTAAGTNFLLFFMANVMSSSLARQAAPKINISATRGRMVGTPLGQKAW